MQAVLALREAALREWAVLNPGQRLALLRFLVEQVCRTDAAGRHCSLSLGAAQLGPQDRRGRKPMPNILAAAAAAAGRRGSRGQDRRRR